MVHIQKCRRNKSSLERRVRVHMKKRNNMWRKNVITIFESILSPSEFKPKVYSLDIAPILLLTIINTQFREPRRELDGFSKCGSFYSCWFDGI